MGMQGGRYIIMDELKHNQEENWWWMFFIALLLIEILF